MSQDITRPIIGIENRSAQEVFDIMCDRFLASRTPNTEMVVKALEWEKGTHWAQARCKAVGLLQVTHVEDGWDWSIGASTCRAQCDSMDEAIAEAEEEREAAIRAALASPPSPAEGTVTDALEKAAAEAYRVCAETRHVTLGDKASAAILALAASLQLNKKG